MSSAPLPIRPFDGPVDATAPIPGSKSHTNRALLCAGLARGTSTLTGALMADDTRAMMGAIEALGAGITVREEDSVPTVEVVGVDPASRFVSTRVYVNQSGTTSRFLLPVLCGLDGDFTLDGDPQLRARPFGPQLEALAHLGASVEGDRLPLRIAGRTLEGGSVSIDGALSSQFLSGLLLASPMMSQPLTVEVSSSLVSQPYVTLTVATMAQFGIGVEGDIGAGRYRVAPGRYRAADIIVEPDASAASYFFAAAALCGGTIRVEGLDASTVQGDLHFVDVLEQMGVEVRRGEGWTEVTRSGELRGITVDMSDISDTAQTLAVVATAASSPTEITGIGFIQAKETKRVTAVVTELRRLGVAATETDDGMIIEPGPVAPGVVNTYDDHRMAMSFALLGLVNPGIAISDPACVSKTFPNYFQALEQIRPGA